MITYQMLLKLNMVVLSRFALVSFVVSSLPTLSRAWSVESIVGPSRRLDARYSTSFYYHAGYNSKGFRMVSAESAEPDPTDPSPPVEQQPWWEEERRTQGMPTLTKTTQWRMLLSLRDPAKGGAAGESTEVAVRVRFDEDEGFEPPQGSLEIIEDNPYFTRQAGKARWILSEAEDKRGAGLWVWGLFKDPLYPFLLLQVDNLEITLRGGAKIAAGRLYVKADHRRDDELGPTLKSGTVGVKLVERVQVDPLGMAEADISSVVPCGSVQFRPV